MVKESRKHHYISQFYLKGFAEREEKDPLITVMDMIAKKEFEATSKNISGIRDFNRVDLEGRDPDFVEKELSKFETRVANAMRSVHYLNKFEGEDRALILEFIAMIAARNPHSRQNRSSFYGGFFKAATRELVRNSKEWSNRTISLLKNLNPEKEGSVSEEDIKRFIDDIEVDIATAHHIHTELKMIVQTIHLLDNRKWSLLQSSLDTGPFITSDAPVILCWENPDEVPIMLRNSPGFGWLNTIVYFPLSKNLALIGRFDGEEAIVPANKVQVAVINTMQIIYSQKQLYMPNTDFHFLTKNDGIQKGCVLLE